VDELLGSQSAEHDPFLDDDGINLCDSFQGTSIDIEEWTTGQPSHHTTDGQTPVGDASTCYGVVSEMGENAGSAGLNFLGLVHPCQVAIIVMHGQLTRIYRSSELLSAFEATWQSFTVISSTFRHPQSQVMRKW
jgi:hypothetical protein